MVFTHHRLWERFFSVARRVNSSKRVEVYPRSDWQRHPGGDVILAGRYVAAYRRMGLEADLVSTPSSDAEIVHLMNVDRLVEFERSVAGLPSSTHIIVTPLHHSFADQGDFFASRPQGRSRLDLLNSLVGSPWLRENLAHVYRRRRDLGTILSSRPFRRSSKPAAIGSQLLDRGALILPNSTYELSAIAESFGVCESKMHVVRNVVDERSETSKQFGSRKFDVLVAARIEPRKNQLGVVEALEGSGLSVLFVGDVGKSSRSYAEQVVAAIARTPQMEYQGHVSTERMTELYQDSRVALSASFFEASSLVDCEALLNGCVVVGSERGGSASVLSGYGVFGDPYHLDAWLVETIMEGLDSGPRSDAGDFVLARFSEAAIADRLARLMEATGWL